MYNCLHCQATLEPGMEVCPGCGFVFPQPVPDSISQDVPTPSNGSLNQAAQIAAKSWDIAQSAAQGLQQAYRAAHPPPVDVTHPDQFGCFFCQSQDIYRVIGVVSQGITTQKSTSRSIGSVGLMAAGGRTNTETRTASRLASMLQFQYPGIGCIAAMVPGFYGNWKYKRACALARWQNLWYCPRCDVVLDPNSRRYAPPNQAVNLYRN